MNLFARLKAFRKPPRDVRAARPIHLSRVEPLELRIAPATFTVTNVADAGAGSLRQAINDANALAGLDTIAFNIPGNGPHVIQPHSALPALSTAMVIDGYTEPGAAVNTLAVGSDAVLQIVLDGSLAGAANGLMVSSSGTKVRGLAIHSFLDPSGTAGTGAGIAISRSDVTIEGNFIGTDQTGSTDLGNQRSGIFSSGENNVVIGGATPAARNIILGNGEYGIAISNSGGSGNLVAGNYIGTDRTGALDLGNSSHGILVGAVGVTIGGSAQGLRNVISGNGGSGIQYGSGSGGSILGNYIGLNATGDSALANAASGISISGGGVNTIGGAAAGEGNVISGNGSAGITMSGAINTTVLGNFIGTTSNGQSALGNAGAGVSLGPSDNGSRIGGTAAGEGNRIAFNQLSGISSFFSGTTRFRGNSIFSNGGLGINLAGGTEDAAGVTANDVGDADSGVNGLQNYPLITGASVAGSSTIISGTLNSTASGTFAIDLFVNTAADPSGYGEGQTYLGTTDVTTNASGDGSFTFTAPAAYPGANLTATATNSGNATSEFNALREIAGTVVTTASDVVANDGLTSLREAIMSANSSPGLDTIRFAIPGSGLHAIAVTSALPTITDAVIIDGFTQPDASANTLEHGSNAVYAIELQGSGAGPNADGLFITGGGSTIRGLVINGFSGFGVYLQTGGSNRIEGNFIGTNALGDAAQANVQSGIFIEDSASNTIGGTEAAAKNVISGNGGDGITIEGAGATGNIVQGNLIGTDASGAGEVPNVFDGLFVFEGASGNVIGGPESSARNIISGNGFDGVNIQGTLTTGNFVQGNYIGTDVSGTVAIPNQGFGITLSGPANTIGGLPAGAGNLISGNTSGGILIFSFEGSDGSTNMIQGNLVGTDSTGTVAIGNGGNGITINTAHNLIGGTTLGEGNVVSGNAQLGISIQSSGGSDASGNTVQGNFIGTNATGTAGLGNLDDGILILSDHNLIGGTAPGTRNLISGNGDLGLAIGDPTAEGNIVQGNFIGTDLTGTAAIPNASDGVLITGGATSNLIGGTSAGARNLISGNGRDGVNIAEAETSSNMVQGNYIGTDVSGTVALGNTGFGVVISGAANTIGGANLGAGNVISGNPSAGILISDFDGGGGGGNLVQGNRIGTDATGTDALGNGDGIFIQTSDNTIGGIGAGEGNLISGNTGDGVRLDGEGSGNRIVGNSIHQNGGLGINLAGDDDLDDGVTPNDEADEDEGPNGLQNFPEITSVDNDATGTTIHGTLKSEADSEFTVDFYANGRVDASGLGEGEMFLGSVTVNTDDNGEASFSFTPTITVVPGRFVTATATNSANDTSEFSNALAADLNIAGNGKSVTVIDSDGDQVTIKTSKGALTQANFVFAADGSIQAIMLNGDARFNGANVTITAKSTGGAGNGVVDVKLIDATNLDLGNVTISGTLGMIIVGDGDPKKPALKSLTVGSLGTSAVGEPPLLSEIRGALGTLTVKGDVRGAAVEVTGALGKVTIGGDLVGDVGTGAGILAALVEGRSIVRAGPSGGTPVGAVSAGSVGSFTVKGDMNGGSLTSQGNIGSVNVGQDLHGGSVAAAGRIKVVKVLRDLESDDPSQPVLIAALAQVGSTKPAGAVAIDKLVIQGNVENAQILLGYQKESAGGYLPKNSDASAGSVVVNGNWTASSLVAGVFDATGDGFGRNDKRIAQDATPGIISRISSIVIKGTATGSAAAGDHYGITAQKVGKLSIAGQQIALKAGRDDLLLDRDNGDFRLVEF